MNGWIIAFLIIAGIFAYIGVAVLLYAGLFKIYKNVSDEDKDWIAPVTFYWIITLPFFVIVSPFLLFEKLTKMIDEDVEK